MRSKLGVGLVVVSLSVMGGGCDWLYKKVPIKNAYCDGTAQYRCEDPRYPYCDISQNTCVPNSDMGMLGCAGAGDCPDSKPICDSHICRACTGAGDDAACGARSAAAPLCLTEGAKQGACGTCRPATGIATGGNHCASGTPVCTTDGACRKCTTGSECSSGACQDDGTCADPAQVSYVDNNPAKCSAAGPGTQAMPFCQITPAVLLGRPYVVVASSTISGGNLVPYNAVNIASGSVTIVGPGRTTAPAQVSQQPSPAITLQPPAAGSATVVIDGLDLAGSNGSTAAQKKPGVACQGTSGMATLTLRNSSIHDSGGAGIDSSACTIIIDANVIGPSNNGGGISINGGTYVVTNNLIVGNGNNGPGVQLAGNVSGTFAFNTVAGNKRNGTNAGAFNCGGATSAMPPAIFASIIYLNDKSSSGSSVGMGCDFSNVDVDDSSTPPGSGNFKADPLFKDANNGDYRVITGSPCADKVPTPGTPNADHDLDNTHRPQGASGKWTIGANELAR